MESRRQSSGERRAGGGGVYNGWQGPTPVARSYFGTRRASPKLIVESVPRQAIEDGNYNQSALQVPCIDSMEFPVQQSLQLPSSEMTLVSNAHYQQPGQGQTSHHSPLAAKQQWINYEEHYEHQQQELTNQHPQVLAHPICGTDHNSWPSAPISLLNYHQPELQVPCFGSQQSPGKQPVQLPPTSTISFSNVHSQQPGQGQSSAIHQSQLWINYEEQAQNENQQQELTNQHPQVLAHQICGTDHNSWPSAPISVQNYNQSELQVPCFGSRQSPGKRPVQLPPSSTISVSNTHCQQPGQGQSSEIYHNQLAATQQWINYEQLALYDQQQELTNQHPQVLAHQICGTDHNSWPSAPMSVQNCNQSEIRVQCFGSRQSPGKRPVQLPPSSTISVSNTHCQQPGQGQSSEIYHNQLAATQQLALYDQQQELTNQHPQVLAYPICGSDHNSWPSAPMSLLDYNQSALQIPCSVTSKALHDMYLVLQWPPSFGLDREELTLHGLWPILLGYSNPIRTQDGLNFEDVLKFSTWPRDMLDEMHCWFCDILCTSNVQMVQEFMDFELWFHEFDDHGVDSGLTEEEFFRCCLILRSSFDAAGRISKLLQSLKNQRITVSELMTQIETKSGYLVLIEEIDNTNHLKQLKVFVNRRNMMFGNASLNDRKGKLRLNDQICIP